MAVHISGLVLFHVISYDTEKTNEVRDLLSCLSGNSQCLNKLKQLLARVKVGQLQLFACSKTFKTTDELYSHMKKCARIHPVRLTVQLEYFRRMFWGTKKIYSGNIYFTGDGKLKCISGS